MAEGPRCPVCSTTFESEPRDAHGSHRLLQCPSCDLQLWFPPTPGDAAWYDASDHYLASPVVDWLGWYHRWAVDHVPAGTRTLLDLGCGDGRFVYAVARRGVDARGIDHSLRLVDLGNRRYGGERLSRASLEEFSAAGRRFDVVSLFEVIEHVPDPLALVRTAAEVLAPQGHLIVSTPNRHGRPKPPPALDRPPHHLTRWSQAALRAVLRAAGFEIVELGLSPGSVGIKGFVLDRTRLGILTGLLRRRAAAGGATAGPAANDDVRRLMRAKEAVADAIAAVASPLLGRHFSGGSMVALARRASDRRLR